MEKFDIQVMLQDGTFADYEVHNERDGKIYEVITAGKLAGVFEAGDDGSWSLVSNNGNISDDLQQRIINQLNGFRS